MLIFHKNSGPRVGYMPQEIALTEEFSIKETIYYFGRIYGMNTERIRERYKLLKELLDLPPGNRQVGHCSGGQMRRVSFAAAMVHEPELLILDEPTVSDLKIFFFSSFVIYINSFFSHF